MSKKKIPVSGIVYSTDPGYQPSYEEAPEAATLHPAQQKLKVRLETKHRAGKAVTLVEGFVGTDADRETMVKQLKNYCGTGGSAKDGEILVQGDQRDKILQWLHKNGYQHSKKL